MLATSKTKLVDLPASLPFDGLPPVDAQAIITKDSPTMEGEGLLVLAQAQMDSMDAVDPMDQEGARTTFANEGQLLSSDPDSNDTTAPVDSAASTQDVAAETKTTTSLKTRKRTKTGCLSKTLSNGAEDTGTPH